MVIKKILLAHNSMVIEKAHRISINSINILAKLFDDENPKFLKEALIKCWEERPDVFPKQSDIFKQLVEIKKYGREMIKDREDQSLKIEAGGLIKTTDELFTEAIKRTNIDNLKEAYEFFAKHVYDHVLVDNFEDLTEEEKIKRTRSKLYMPIFLKCLVESKYDTEKAIVIGRNKARGGK